VRLATIEETRLVADKMQRTTQYDEKPDTTPAIVQVQSKYWSRPKYQAAHDLQVSADDEQWYTRDR
jgi:hypothetical protein